jgi:hypothetical protein
MKYGLPTKMYRADRPKLYTTSIYKMHVQAIRDINGISGYYNHILNTGHTYRSINDTLKVLKTERESRNTEKYRM